ncbi:MAG: D-2-hydroxyacid dehydrogenase [Acidobacteriota bacterium]
MRVLVAIFSDTPAWTIPSAQVEELRRRFPAIDFVHAEDEEAMARLIPDADVAFTSRLTPSAFEAAGRLAWVHSSAAGIGRMLFPAMARSPVALTNSRGMNAPAVAEHTFAMLLALARRLPAALRAQAESRWVQDELSGLPVLRGKTLGIIGLGAIGCELARLGHAFGMRVTGLRRRPDLGCPAGVDEVLGSPDLARLLRACDVAVVSAPLTPETRGLVGIGEFRLMRATALFANVSRGKLVREADLVAALKDGLIAGAALDVFEHEPLDPLSPLWAMPNVVITPHVAGFRADYWEAAVDLFSENLGRFMRGEPLLNVVDKERGY